MAIDQKLAKEIKERIEAGTLPGPVPGELPRLNRILAHYGLEPIKSKDQVGKERQWLAHKRY